MRRLAHQYGDRQVLHDVAFDVAPGEVVGLLGPNGSGKSTVLSALQGLLRPTAADVTLDGVAVSPGGSNLRARLGVVFQQPTLDLSLTVRQNMTYFAALHGLPRNEVPARIDAALDRLNMRERANEKPLLEATAAVVMPPS
mgnify:CR=1 FL=1